MLRHLKGAVNAGHYGVLYQNTKTLTAETLPYFTSRDISGDKLPTVWGHVAIAQEDHTILVHGGSEEKDSVVGTASCIDTQSAACETCATSSTEPIHFHGAVRVENMTLGVAFGGQAISPAGSLDETDSTNCYDTSLGLWYPAATTGAAPSARSGHGMVVVQHGGQDADLNTSADSAGTHSVLRRVMLAGGMSSTAQSTSTVNALHSLSPSGAAYDSDSCALAPGSAAGASGGGRGGRSGGAFTPVACPNDEAVEESSLVVVHGGIRCGRFVNDVHVLDMATYRWSKGRPTGSPPGPRAYHTLTAVTGGRIVLIGGSDDRQAFGDVHVLDTASHPWAWSEPCVSGLQPPARSGHCAIRVSSRHILVCGGWNPHQDGHKGGAFGDAFMLDICTWQWSPVTPDLMPRGLQTVQASGGAVSHGGTKRQADTMATTPSKRRATRTGSQGGVVAVSCADVDVDFGAWALVGRVGACAVLIGDVNAHEPHTCAVLIQGGRDSHGNVVADVAVLPLPLPALQARAEAQALQLQDFDSADGQC
jgi:hypothetical protein